MNRPSKIILFSDVLGGFGGIETYLDALARRLSSEGRPFCVCVSLNGPAPFLEELEELGISIYRQPRILGDRWQLRQNLLVRHVANGLRAGDWVFCVRQPMPGVYLPLVRSAHRHGAKVAASWMFAPEFLPPPVNRNGKAFRQAIGETDVVVSVSECTKHQFKNVYGYDRDVAVVRYHNIDRFSKSAPLPFAPPYQIGFMGRVEIKQKNLDNILTAFCLLLERGRDVIFNIHGGGPDLQ